jgi:hypothetical protein
METRKPACAEDAERGRVFASEIFGGDGGCGGGAQCGEVIGGDGEYGFGGAWIEQEIGGVNAIFASRRVIANHDQLHAESGPDGIKTGHDQKSAAGNLQMLARGDGDARETMAEGVFDACDQVVRAEETTDIGLGEVQNSGALHKLSG